MVEKIGIVGGGQLGRMLTEAAQPLGFQVTVLDPAENCPAARVGADQIQARLDDGDAIRQLAHETDVVTWEIEHIDTETLMDLRAEGTDVQPHPETLQTIQDKWQQKRMLRENGLPVADFKLVAVPTIESVSQAARNLGGAVMLKARRGGFDGRGNLAYEDGPLGSMPAFSEIEEQVGKHIYAEKKVDFERELAVIAARDKAGQVALYPLVETIHKDSICHTVMTLTPREAKSKAVKEAREVAHETLQHLEGAGVFAIEMFDTGSGILINEIAPRVHNSGHLTIEANATSQFEQHIRAVTGMPLGSVDERAPTAAMINILGTREETLNRDGLERVLALPDTHPHFYGKDPRPARKVGHITVLGSSVTLVRMTVKHAREVLTV